MLQNIHSKIKESFIVAGVAVGILFALFLFIWIPFKVIPSLFANGTNFVSTTLTSTLIPNEKLATSTDAITKDTTPTATTSTVTTTTTETQQTTSQPITKHITLNTVQTYYGQADLSVTLIATGILDPQTRQFVATNYAGANDQIAVKFQVKNIGTNVSGQWKLRLNMPSRTTPSFDSWEQSIKPGDAIEYTGGFDSPTSQGMNTGYIIIDPLYALSESSKDNNTLLVQFNITGTTNTNYNYNTNNSYGGTYSYTNTNSNTYGGNYTYGNNNTYGGTYTTNPNPYYGQTYTWSNISVNCYANPQDTTRGGQVTWYATVTGGNGYNTYYWVGDDNIYSTSNSFSHVYYTTGVKYATVSVTSGGQTITKECAVNIH